MPVDSDKYKVAYSYIHANYITIQQGCQINALLSVNKRVRELIAIKKN